jgi:hypothetical protein
MRRRQHRSVGIKRNIPQPSPIYLEERTIVNPSSCPYGFAAVRLIVGEDAIDENATTVRTDLGTTEKELSESCMKVHSPAGLEAMFYSNS